MAETTLTPSIQSRASAPSTQSRLFQDIADKAVAVPKTVESSYALSRHRISLTDRDRARKEFSAACLRLPGVYVIYDDADEVIYIGKSKNLRSRLLSYFRARNLGDKACRIWTAAASVMWEVLPDEFSALHREIELIEALTPRFNVRDNPEKRSFKYLCLGRRPAPYFYLASSMADAIEAIGPLPKSAQLRESVQTLNDIFRLRDCPKRTRVLFSNQQEMWQGRVRPGCIRADVGKCLGSCAARCLSSEYDVAAANARTFILGDDRSIRVELAEKISEHSERLEFEAAAKYHGYVGVLDWLRDEVAELCKTRERLSFVYPSSDCDSRLLFVIHRGRVLGIFPADPRSEQRDLAIETIQAAERLQGDGGGYLTENYNFVLNWFRRNPLELSRTQGFAEVISAWDHAYQA